MWETKPNQEGYYWYQDNEIDEPTVVYVTWNHNEFWMINFVEFNVSLSYDEVSEKDTKFHIIVLPD